MTDHQLVRVEHIGPAEDPASVVQVTMDNASRRNALGPQMLESLSAAIGTAADGPCRAMILRAAPGVTTWSAGYDIEALPLDGADPLTWANPLETLLHAVRAAPYPVIAAVEGGVWGGACELSLTCDLVIAVRTATFAITPARLGVPYNTSGVAHFLAALPLNVAREMFFTADAIGAESLAQYGVVNRLVGDSEELDVVAREFAQRIATRAPLSVRAIKAEVAALTDARSLTSDDFERLTELRRQAWTSEDYQEGVRAFREKRAPRFTGA